MSAESTYDQLCTHARETALLTSVQGLLEWDERTKLPAAGGEYRAEQVTYLAGQVHEKQTSTEVGQWLAELVESPLATDPLSDTGTVIRRLQRDYNKQTRLPKSLVEELARATVLGQQAWAEARADDDFAHFQPLLERIVGLKQQEAAAIGFDESPYDALLDTYEPEARTAEVAEVLNGLREEWAPRLDRILGSGRQADTGLLTRHYPAEAQEKFGTQAATAIGFDFHAGRLDITDHPFCCDCGPQDIRLTTRYDQHNLVDGLFSILHEAGHGIYEQGLPSDCFGLPTGQSISMGIHESQSRLWENQVGRSRAFWQRFFPAAQRAFPTALRDVSIDDFYWAINSVRPTLIRVDADEGTYDLHILIRFELERALITDDLRVADLPAAWNAKYRDYLGIEPPGDADGVLQDVHWSAGLFGYFPTYSLGNLYAAQFFEQAEQDLGDLGEQFRRGDFAPLNGWLQQHIYRHGRRFSAAELVEQVTGKPLSRDPLVRHLSAKYEPLYGLS